MIRKNLLQEAIAGILVKGACWVHACPRCVIPNLRLCSIEAAWQLSLERFGPFMVDIDAHDNSHFEWMDEAVAARLPEVYRMLGIPPGFAPTKLWDSPGHRGPC